MLVIMPLLHEATTQDLNVVIHNFFYNIKFLFWSDSHSVRIPEIVIFMRKLKKGREKKQTKLEDVEEKGGKEFAKGNSREKLKVEFFLRICEKQGTAGNGNAF